MKEIIIIIDERAITKYNGAMTSKRGGIYLSPKVKQFEMAIWYAAMRSIEGMEILECKLNVDIDFYFDNNKMPDLFNLPKAVCDALNTKKLRGTIIRHGVWMDDRQIVSGTLRKSNKGFNKIIITISEAAQ